MSDIGQAQYSMSQFQRIEIDIGATLAQPNGQNRSLGELFPQLEGSGFIVERSDFPVVLSFSSPAQKDTQSFIARDGLEVKSPFKGLYLSHPPMNKVGMRLSLIVFKSCATVDNQYMLPCTRLGILNTAVINTALQMQYAIYIPPGARALMGFQVTQLATTITDSILSVVDSAGSSLLNPTNVTSVGATGTTRTYNNNSSTTYSPLGAALVMGTSAVLNFPNVIVLPTQAYELSLLINGTGLSANVGFGGYFV